MLNKIEDLPGSPGITTVLLLQGLRFDPWSRKFHMSHSTIKKTKIENNTDLNYAHFQKVTQNSYP